MSGHTTALLHSDLTSIWHRGRSHFLWVSFLLGFFLFLIHVFGALSFGAARVTDQLEDKLGMFFYIQDYESLEDHVYTSVIRLQDDLEDVGISSDFVSKEQALNNLLGSSDVGLIDGLQSVGIGNPLPATLYVRIATQDDLLTLKRVLVPYRNIITNAGQLTSLNALSEQEARNTRTIAMSRLVQRVSFVIMAGLLVGCLVLLMYFVRTLLGLFDEEIRIKKELGASYGQIVAPLVVSVLAVVTLGWIVMLVCSAALALIAGSSALVGSLGSVRSLLGGSLIPLGLIGIVELFVLETVAFGLSRRYVIKRL